MRFWEKYKSSDQVFTIAGLYEASLNSSESIASLERWDVEKLIARTVTEQTPVTFNEMLPLWFGRGAISPVAASRIQEYVEYSEKMELKSEFNSLLSVLGAEVAEGDLGPIQDYVVLERQLEKLYSFDQQITILEIGGGFGYLASIFLRESKHKLCYVLVDGVPESVYYQWCYLSDSFPDLNIGASFNGDKFDAHVFDIFILPAWDAENFLVESQVDLVINVASMQEMPDKAYKAYFKFIDKVLKTDGLFFFQNSRDAYYKREYVYPDTYQYLLKCDTPRSRTFDYPLDLLQKKESNLGVDNLKLLNDYLYSQSIKAKAIISEKNSIILSEKEGRKSRVFQLLGVLGEKTSQIELLKSRINERVEFLDGVKSRNGALLNSLSKKESQIKLLQCKIQEMKLAQVNGRTGLVGKLKKRNEALINSLNKKEAQIKLLQCKINDMKLSKVNRHVSVVESLKKRNESLLKALNQKAKQVAVLKSKVRKNKL